MTGIVIAAEEKYLLVEVERTFAYISRRNLIFLTIMKLDNKLLLAEDIVKSKMPGKLLVHEQVMISYIVY